MLRGWRIRKKLLREEELHLGFLATTYLWFVRWKPLESILYVLWFMAPILSMLIPMYFIDAGELMTLMSGFWYLIFVPIIFGIFQPYIITFTDLDNEEIKTIS